MANKALFASAFARHLPAADTFNREWAPAYAFGPEHKLAQLAATGTLQDNFYSGAEAQLAEVIQAASAVDPLFVAKATVYSRRRGPTARRRRGAGRTFSFADAANAGGTTW